MAQLEIDARKQECQTVTHERDKIEAEAKALREAADAANELICKAAPLAWVHNIQTDFSYEAYASAKAWEIEAETWINSWNAFPHEALRDHA